MDAHSRSGLFVVEVYNIDRWIAAYIRRPPTEPSESSKVSGSLAGWVEICDLL